MFKPLVTEEEGDEGDMGGVHGLEGDGRAVDLEIGLCYQVTD